jgi:cytochrome d ubiquinol oxidase subunit II
VGLAIGYAMLGAGWIIWKTEGQVQRDAFRLARWLLPSLIAVIGLVSLLTPFLEGKYYQRWFVWPGWLVAAPMPLLVGLAALIAWRGIARGEERTPFLATLALFGLSFIGLGVSIWPDTVPGRLTIWQTASPQASQAFMLIGVVVILPLILAYTAWAYWVFRGKVRGGYH